MFGLFFIAILAILIWKHSPRAAIENPINKSESDWKSIYSSSRGSYNTWIRGSTGGIPHSWY